VHDGAVVVLHEVVSVGLVELAAVSIVYVFPVNPDIIVPVASLLLVPHSQSVTDLVNRDSKLHNGRTNEPTVTLHVAANKCHSPQRLHRL